MLDDLRAWLNGDREYFSGVILYAKVGDNDALKTLFSKGKTDYCNERLQVELLKICRQLKAQGNEGEKHEHKAAASRSVERTLTTTKSSQAVNAVHEPIENAELYSVCKAEADKSYKAVMNLRAELFALTKADDYSDPNTPDRIEQRSKLAVKVAEDFKKVSQMYERADYVKLHGRLPDQGEADDEELNPDGLPDHLVKQTLDNLRKNYNKMKKREQTPERVALLQKHEANIKQLEARWLLLRPAK